jgi:hypothetical protein
MPDVNKLSKRPAEYLWETGVAPLSAGLAFFLLGASDLLQRILPQTDLAQQGIKWLAICFVVAVFWVTRSIKDRVVSPRGGYVEPAQPKWLLWLLLPALFVPLILVHTLTPVGSAPGHDFLDNDKLIVPGFAVLFGVMSLYEGWKRKMSLLLAYGIYLICLALLIWWLPLSATERYGLLQSGAGGPLAVFGAMRLRTFIKANPKPVDLTTGG